jgi:hypothetical protein
VQATLYPINLVYDESNLFIGLLYHSVRQKIGFKVRRDIEVNKPSHALHGHYWLLCQGMGKGQFILISRSIDIYFIHAIDIVRVAFWVLPISR